MVRRVLAAFLAISVMVDGNPAAAVVSGAAVTVPSLGMRRFAPLFGRQAITPFLLSTAEPERGLSPQGRIRRSFPEELHVSQRRAGERGAVSLSRRTLLGLGGASALGALASYLFRARPGARPAPQTPPAPSNSDWLAERPGEFPFDYHRRILLEGIARQKNFEPVLSRLILPPSFSVRVEDIRQAVAKTRALIADHSHPIAYLPPDDLTDFEIQPGQPPTIAVNASDLAFCVSEVPETILHETVHLTAVQQKMQRAMNALLDRVFQSLAPYIDRSQAARRRQAQPERAFTYKDFAAAGFWDIDTFRKHPALKSAAYQFLRGRSRAEFEAWYVMIAARVLSAGGNSPLDELAQHFRSYAHAESVDDFVEDTWKYGGPQDPFFRHRVLSFIVEYRMAKGFEIGRISETFLNSYIRMGLAGTSRGFDSRLVTALARADFDPHFVMEKVAEPAAADSDYISRFDAWAAHSFLPGLVPASSLARRGELVPLLPFPSGDRGRSPSASLASEETLGATIRDQTEYERLVEFLARPRKAVLFDLDGTATQTDGRSPDPLPEYRDVHDKIVRRLAELASHGILIAPTTNRRKAKALAYGNAIVRDSAYQPSAEPSEAPRVEVYWASGTGGMDLVQQSEFKEFELTMPASQQEQLIAALAPMAPEIERMEGKLNFRIPRGQKPEVFMRTVRNRIKKFGWLYHGPEGTSSEADRSMLKVLYAGEGIVSIIPAAADKARPTQFILSRHGLHDEDVLKIYDQPQPGRVDHALAQGGGITVGDDLKDLPEGTLSTKKAIGISGPDAMLWVLNRAAWEKSDPAPSLEMENALADQSAESVSRAIPASASSEPGLVQRIRLHQRFLADLGPSHPARTQYVNELDNLVGELSGTLKRMIHTPLRHFQERIDGLREPLIQMVSNQEVLFKHIFTKVVQRVQTLPAGHRLMIGFSGTSAGGKTTYAAQMETDLAALLLDEQAAAAKKSQRFVPCQIRTYSQDDFIIPRNRRVPLNTLDPNKRFELQRHVDFAESLRQNRRAAKPMYDQTTKGRLEFGLIEDGRIALFNGDRILALALHPDGRFDFDEYMEVVRDTALNDHDEIVTLMGRRYVNLATRRQSMYGNPHRGLHDLSATFLCGSTPVRLERLADGRLSIRLRDSQFYLKSSKNESAILQTPGEPDRPLRLKHRLEEPGVEALEVWDPVPAAERQVVIGEGFLLQTYSGWDVSANVNASFFIRLVRTIQREIRRQRPSEEIEKAVAARIRLQWAEDLFVDRLNRQAKRSRGIGVQATHYQINSLSLAELVLRNVRYGLLSVQYPDQAMNLEAHGIDLNRMIATMMTLGQRGLIRWVDSLCAALGTEGVFTRPKFEGEKELTLVEEWERYFAGRFRTVGIGPLLVKFQHALRSWGSGTRLGMHADLSEEEAANDRKILARGQGVVVDFEVTDLTDSEAGRRFPFKALVRPGHREPIQEAVHEVKLHRVLVLNSIPFVERKLSDIGRAYRQFVKEMASAARHGQEARLAGLKAESDQLIRESERDLIDPFFAVQETMWRRGIVDKAPHLPYRYGFGIFHGVEKIQCTGIGSLIVNDSGLETLHEVDALAASQEREPLSQKYSDVPGYLQLRGYQRQFVRNVNEKGIPTGDFLALIPAPLRAYFVQKILETVPVYSGLENSGAYPAGASTFKGRGHFEEDWIQAQEAGETEKFRINGVSSAAVDEERLNYIEGYLAENYFLRHLMAEFRVHFDEVPPLESTTPQAAWVALFLESLPHDPNNTLFTLTGVLFEQIVRMPWRMEQTLTERDGDRKNAAEQLVEAARTELTRQREAAGDVKPYLKDWERDVFLKFLELALSLPYTWKEFYDRHSPGGPLRSGASVQDAAGHSEGQSGGQRGALSLGRRDLLGLGGASALGAWAYHHFYARPGARPAPQTPSAPSNSDWLAERPGEFPFDYHRRILLETMARQQNFEPVLSRLVLPSSFEVGIRDIREGVATLRSLLADRSRLLEYLPPKELNVFEVRDTHPPTLAVSAPDLVFTLSRFPEALLHESVHLSPIQRRREQSRMALAGRLTRSLIPYLDPIEAAQLRRDATTRTLTDKYLVEAALWDIDTFRTHPALKPLAYQYLRDHLKIEFEAWYVDIAAHILLARGASPLNALAELIHAYRPAESVEDFVDEVFRGDVPNDPVFLHRVLPLVVNYRMTKGFKMGEVSTNFLNAFLRNFIFGRGYNGRLVASLARADFDAGYTPEKVIGSAQGDSAYAARFDAWAARAFLPEYIPARASGKPTAPTLPTRSRRGWLAPFAVSFSSRARARSAHALREAA